MTAILGCILFLYHCCNKDWMSKERFVGVHPNFSCIHQRRQHRMGEAEQTEDLLAPSALKRYSRNLMDGTEWLIEVFLGVST